MRPVATAVALTAAGTGAVSAIPTALWGFWLSTSAAATVTIYDNASAASGTVLAQWTTAGATDRQIALGNAVRCAAGIFVQVSAGTITGSIWIE